MFCSKCGEKISGDLTFCPECGSKVVNDNAENSIKTIRLVCKSCGGTLNTDESKRVLLCPYCGNKELIAENDSVAVEKIKSNTYKELELHRLEYKIRQDRQQELINEAESIKEGKFRTATVIFFVVCIIFCAMSFFTERYLMGATALVQTLFFGASWTVGANVKSSKQRIIYIITGTVGFILIIPFIILMGK